jgi:hypothetical protein
MLPLGTVLDRICSISSEVGKVHIDIAGQTEGTCHSAHEVPLAIISLGVLKAHYLSRLLVLRQQAL